MAELCDPLPLNFCPQSLEQGSQIGRQRALEAQELAASRMLEAENRRVQGLPAQRRERLPRPLLEAVRLGLEAGAVG